MAPKSRISVGPLKRSTALGWLTVEPLALRPFLLLPSQHETGYPGLYLHDNRVWASYYSSQSGKCAIYIAEVELTKKGE